jgi:hypothetical protein
MSSILLPGGVLAGRKTLRFHKMPSDKEAFDMAQGFAEFIGTIYPGYLWRVQINGDLVTVINLNLQLGKGFRVPLADIDSEGKVLMRAAGELLERASLPRGRRDQNRLKDLPRDIKGNVLGM